MKQIILIVLLLGMHCVVDANEPFKSSNPQLYAWLQQLCSNNVKLPAGWDCAWLNEAESQTSQQNELQDMKNFLAVSQLQQAKAEAELRFMPPPYLAATMQAGYQDEQARHLLLPVKKIYEDYFTDWNILLRPGVADIDYFINSHLQKYCSLNEEKSGLCHAHSGSKEPKDLNASTLLGQNILANKNEQDAAGLFIRNITNPIPVPLLPKSEMFKNVEKKVLSEEGKENLSAKYRQQTLVSLAQESYVSMLADRMPFQSAVSGASANGKKSLSRTALLEQEANRRFSNASWYNQMNSLSTESLLREIANMLALQLALEQKNNLRMERIEALLAAQVSYIAQTIGSAEQARQASAEVMPQDEE